MKLHAGILAGTAGLLLVGVIHVRRTRDALAERDLWRTNIGIHLVGAAEDVDLDVKMQFAHPFQDGLPRFLISGDAERRVFGGEFRQRDTELLLVGLGLWLDRNLDDRIRKLHLL